MLRWPVHCSWNWFIDKPMVTLLSLEPTIIDEFTIYSSWVLVETNSSSLKLLPLKNKHIYIEFCGHQNPIELGLCLTEPNRVWPWI